MVDSPADGERRWFKMTGRRRSACAYLFGTGVVAVPTFPLSIIWMRNPEKGDRMRTKLQPPRNRQRGFHLRVALKPIDWVSDRSLVRYWQRAQHTGNDACIQSLDRSRSRTPG